VLCRMTSLTRQDSAHLTSPLSRCRTVSMSPGDHLSDPLSLPLLCCALLYCPSTNSTSLLLAVSPPALPSHPTCCPREPAAKSFIGDQALRCAANHSHQIRERASLTPLRFQLSSAADCKAKRRAVARILSAFLKSKQSCCCCCDENSSQ
jgi:hypothetical protein